MDIKSPRKLDYAPPYAGRPSSRIVKLASTCTFTSATLYILGILLNEWSFVRHQGYRLAWLLVILFAISLLASIVALLKKSNRRPIAWISLGLALAFWVIFLLSNVGGA
jgi:hypothetical protein